MSFASGVPARYATTGANRLTGDGRRRSDHRDRGSCDVGRLHQGARRPRHRQPRGLRPRLDLRPAPRPVAADAPAPPYPQGRHPRHRHHRAPHRRARQRTRPGAPGRTRPVPGVLRIRALGQAELGRVIPNGHLAAEFLARAWKVTPQHTLISMEGAEGSYLLKPSPGSSATAPAATRGSTTTCTPWPPAASPASWPTTSRSPWS